VSSLPTHTHSFTAQYPPHCHHPHHRYYQQVQRHHRPTPTPPQQHEKTTASTRPAPPRDATVESGRHGHEQACGHIARARAMAVGGRRAAAAACGRWCLVILAVASALGVSGPALYWRYKKGFSSPASGAAAVSAPSCPPCTCDCPPPLSLQSIAPGPAPLSSDLAPTRDSLHNRNGPVG
uniref:Uncharacterized protein n=1 Tax=Aegilops tauschii subsp. strangulata TaxID=200361 RepID=A0A453CCG0_AEGTS